MEDNNYKNVKAVAIFGYAGAAKEESLWGETYEVSKKLADEGFVVVNGGGPGVMEAATMGAESVQGQTITVTLEPKYAPNFEDKYLGNKPDEEIATSNYIERMFTLIAESDFFVIMNGGTGTLSEFATVWLLAWLYKGRHKGFVLYGEYWKEIVDVLVKNMRIQKGSLEVFEIVSTPEEVVGAIRRYEEKMKDVKKNWPADDEEAAFMV
mgnify:CR=1 FL=1